MTTGEIILLVGEVAIEETHMTTGEIILLVGEVAIGGIMVLWWRATRSIWAAQKDLMQERIELLKDQIPDAQDLVAKVKIFEKDAEVKVQKIQQQMDKADEEYRQELEKERAETIALQNTLGEIRSYFAVVEYRKKVMAAAIKNAFGIKDDDD